MIDLFPQKHSTCLSYQAQRGVSFFLTVNQGEEWPQIDFTDDREGCLFTATVSRTIAASSVKSSVKTEEQILGYLSEKTEMTIPDLAEALGLSTRAVEKQIAKLRKGGRLRRVGSRKAGRWEVLGVDE
jgi:ATP-dependent DNA helicase RecG